MPIPEKAVQPQPGAESDGETTRLSRRSVLRGAAGAGAAGLAMTAFAGPALAAARPAHPAAGRAVTDAAARHDDHVTDGEDVVVHVRNLRSGEMDVYRGTSHVRVTDRDLAVRLARASK